MSALRKAALHKPLSDLKSMDLTLYTFNLCPSNNINLHVQNGPLFDKIKSRGAFDIDLALLRPKTNGP